MGLRTTSDDEARQGIGRLIAATSRSRFFFDCFVERFATLAFLRARFDLLGCAVDCFAGAAFDGAFAPRSLTMGGVSAVAATGVATVTATARRSQRSTACW